MLSKPYSGYTRVTADTLITTHPCLLHGVTILPSANYGNIRIYDGVDATSGELVYTLMGLLGLSWQIHHNPPVYLSKGLFVNMVTTMTEATVFWQAADEEDDSQSQAP